MKNKDKVLIIRISSDEDEILRAMALNAKITISQLVRDRIFKKYITVPVMTKESTSTKGDSTGAIQAHNVEIHQRFMSKNQ